MVVIGCTAMGGLVAFQNWTRVKQLRELGRIVGYISGEIRYGRNVISLVCKNISKKTSKVFARWLDQLSELMNDDCTETFLEIWRQAGQNLYIESCFKKSDMEYVSTLGQLLGYLDVEAQESGLRRLQEDIQEKVRSLEMETKMSSRVSVVVGVVAGLLMVLVLV